MNKAHAHLIWRAVIGFVLVTAIAAWLDLLALKEGLNRPEIFFLDDVLAGLIAAALLYVAGLRAIERQQALERRLQIVADMNHHIRNALQAIVYSATLTGANKYTEIVEGSVRRIEWALDEILPPSDRNPSAASPPQQLRSDKIDKIHGSE